MEIYKSNEGLKYAVISDRKNYTADILTTEVFDINREMVDWYRNNYKSVKATPEIKEQIWNVLEVNYQLNLF